VACLVFAGKSTFELTLRNIHELFQPFWPEKAHGYCALLARKYRKMLICKLSISRHALQLH
jgi:hypothetical protein